MSYFVGSDEEIDIQNEQLMVEFLHVSEDDVEDGKEQVDILHQDKLKQVSLLNVLVICLCFSSTFHQNLHIS